MPTDLKYELRALVDAAPPVGADEAIALAEARHVAMAADAGRGERAAGGGPGSDLPGRSWRWVRPVTVAACAVALAGAGTGWALTAETGPPAKTGTPTPRSPGAQRTILTAADVAAIASRSTSAAASSGTAQVTQTSSQDGVPQDGYDVADTFSGANIDEKITSVPEPPGSASSFTTDDRLVDGQFYMYTPGPDDVLEWLHDTNSADDVASMQFPDPRTLYGAISAGAAFRIAGTSTMGGETVTELVAGDPSAVDTAALGNLAEGAAVTSFEIWVDANDVVQQIALSTSERSRVCTLEPLTQAEQQELTRNYGETVRLPDGKTAVVIPKSAIRTVTRSDCGAMTTVTHVTVAFADLGVPQSVTAPEGAVDVTGKG